MPWVLGVILIAVAVAASGYWSGNRGRAAASAGSAGIMTDLPTRRHAGGARWFMVSRLMPRSAGRRWLAEAESLLPEIAAALRGAAIRSYLLSAPQLVGTRGSAAGAAWPRRPGD